MAVVRVAEIRPAIVTVFTHLFTVFSTDAYAGSLPPDLLYFKSHTFDNQHAFELLKKLKDGQSPGLLCMMPPSVKMVVAVI